MQIDRSYIIQQFNSYVSQYNMDDVKIRLKYEHTFHVAENGERIARSLNLSKEDVDLAWVLGIFHDMGRFEQLRRYGTFRDAESINHAALSADLLFHENIAADFLPDLSREDSDTRLMERAVRYHNVYRLPDSLTTRERMFSDILRDADKVDIFRVNCETPRTEIYNLTEEDFLYSDMTEEVYQFMVSGQEVDRRYSKTGIDFIMGHIAFVYGLVYPESRRIVDEQGYLAEMLSFNSQNPNTQERILRIREYISCLQKQ